MKPTAFLRRFLAITGSAALTISYAHAATLTWDNAAGGVITDGAGAWLGAGLWNNSGTPSATWTSGDDAIFGNGGAGGAVTLASPTVVNSITFNSFTGTYTLGTAASTMTLNNGITMNSGAGAATIISPITLGAAQSWTNNSTSLLTVGTGAVTNGGYLLTIGGTGNTTVSSIIGGAGGLTKSGSGILTLSNNFNQFTGNTVITNGKVALGAQFALMKSAYDTTSSTGAIGLNATGQVAPVLGGLAGSVDLATAITAYTSITSLTLNPQTGSSVSYGGNISNATMTLSKTGYGTQTLTGANSYGGATTIYAGTLALSGASGSVLNSAFSVKGGTLSLDNSGGAWVNRIADTGAASVLSLGSLSLTSYNNAGIQTETVGATSFTTGGKVTITNGTGTAQTTLAMGTVTRSAGAAVDFVGTNGTLGGGANSPNVTSSSWPALTNSILPWATVGGTNWATTGANGIVAYSPGSFVDPTSAASNALNNAQLTGSGTMNAVKSFNSLNVISSVASQSFDLSTAGVLTLTSGGILKSGINAYTISGSAANAITAGTELITHVDGGALTISAPLNSAIVGIAKGGTGNLILTGTRAGTLSGAVGLGGGTLEFQGLTTTITGPITGPGGLTVNLNAGQKLVFSNQNKNYSGPTVVKSGILQLGTAWNAQSWSTTGTPSGDYSGNTQPGLSNIELSGGHLAIFYYTSWFLGSGPGQIQLTGGASGFSFCQGGGDGSNAITFNGDTNYEVVWGASGEGAATGFFNPSTLVLSENAATPTSSFRIPNKFDLNGTTRNIAVNSASWAGTLLGVIRNSSGTAGITKTGVGTLNLSGANTYNGAVTVSQGTLSVGFLANGGVVSGLGASSNAATNLLLANGTTLQYTGGAISTDRSFTINGTTAGDGASLDASGSAAVNFTNTATPAYGTTAQTRTLTLTGTNTGNNILAANIADNSGAAVSLTKTGAGLWVLSGTTSSYTGPTTITAGTLSVGASSNLSGASSNLVLNGGTLQITGTGLTSFTGLGRTNPVVFNSGVYVGLDINNVGNTFIADQVLNQGSGGLTKLGTGTLQLNQANTYTGATMISAGTLQLGSGTAAGSLNTGSGINIASGATFAVNQTDTVTQGTDFSSTIIGAGSLANVGSGTLVLNAPTYHTGNTSATLGNITLSHALAIQNSALNTTGSGFVTLSGVTTPTFGGLANSGTTRNLATVISTGYGSVTNLTLNPQSGSVTYGGVIANNAANLSLTKSGAGTQILSGANTYTGTTIINAGTLTIGNATAGSLNGTTGTALTFGGTGTFNVAEAAGSNQGMTSLSLNAGDATVQSTFTATSANLTFAAAPSRTAGATGTFIISAGAIGTAGTNANGTLGTNNIKLTGQTGQTPMGVSYFVGTASGSNYAFYDGAGFVRPLDYVKDATPAGAATYSGVQTSLASSTYAQLQSGGSVSAQANGSTFTGLNIVNSAAATLQAFTLASGATVTVNGILRTGNTSGATSATTISGGTALQAANNAEMIIRTDLVNDFLTINTNIVANGTNVLTKSGAGTLTLGGTNTYTGGTIINAGTLAYNADAALGASSTRNVTFNGTSTLTPSATSSLGTLTINTGAAATLTNGGALTFSSTTGSGSILVSQGGVNTINIGNASTFTGNLKLYAPATNSGTPNMGLQFSSLNDAAGSALQIQGGGSDSNQIATVALAGDVGPLIFNNRQVQILARTGSNWDLANDMLANNNTSTANTWVINTDLLNNSDRAVNSGGWQEFTLRGTNTGNNQFAGVIGDSTSSNPTQTYLVKADAGNWIVSGNNTFTGQVILNQGTLTVSNINNTTVAGPLGMGGAVQLGGIDKVGSGHGFGNNSGTLEYTGSGQTTTRTFQMGDTTAADTSTGTILNDGSGALIFSAANFNPTISGITGTRTLTLGGTNTGANEIQGIIQNNAATGLVAVTKSGIGTWTLSGTNTYTGVTTLSGGGALVLDYGTNNTSKLSDTISALNLGGGTLTLSGATGNHIEVVTSTTLNAGGTFLTRSGANTALLRMNAITRAAGGTISFGNATIADTDTNNVNGILGGWATIGNDWATSVTSGAADTTITALSPSTPFVVTTGSSTANYLLNGSASIVTAGVAANTVKITNSANSQTLALNALNLTITSASATSLGGIMYAGGNDNLYSITGSTGRIVTSVASQELIFAVQTGTLSVGAFVGASGSTGGVTKSGAGTMVISSANDYTGATYVNQGVMRLANNTASGTVAGGINVQNGAELELSNNITVGAEALTITGNGISNGGALCNFTGINTYQGAITIGSGGARINAESGTLTVRSITTASGANVTFSGAGDIAHSTTAISGAGAVVKEGAGTLTLNLTNTYTGGTTLNGGTVAFVNGALSTSGNVAFTGNSTLQWSGVNVQDLSSRLVMSNGVTSTLDTGANNVSFASGIGSSSTGAITKSGSGKLTLNGTNTYAGLTTITGAGTLALGAAGSIDNSSGVALGTAGTFDVSAKSGYIVANLTGSGTVIGSLTVSTGLAIGNSPGLVTYNGDLTLGVASNSIFEVTGGAITGDLGDVSGLLTIATGATLDLVQLGTYTANDKFTLFAYNTLSGTFAGLADDTNFTDNLGGIWKINYNDDTAGLNGGVGSLYVTVTAIPEPGAAFIGSLGMLALLRRRRN